MLAYAGKLQDSVRGRISAVSRDTGAPPIFIALIGMQQPDPPEECVNQRERIFF